MRTASQIADELGATPHACVSSQIRDLRLTYGLPLIAVAQQVGISKSGLSRIERGDVTNMSITTALRLARFYETTVEDLFGPLADDEARS